MSASSLCPQHLVAQEDNGYKVYWSNGAQINSPRDKDIAKHIAQNLVPSFEASE